MNKKATQHIYCEAPLQYPPEKVFAILAMMRLNNTHRCCGGFLSPPCLEAASLQKTSRRMPIFLSGSKNSPFSGVLFACRVVLRGVCLQLGAVVEHHFFCFSTVLGDEIRRPRFWPIPGFSFLFVA
ncbi:MAG: hypothetical protein ABFC54_00575 [Thermoguttaceae bacterium]